MLHRNHAVVFPRPFILTTETGGPHSGLIRSATPSLLNQSQHHGEFSGSVVSASDARPTLTLRPLGRSVSAPVVLWCTILLGSANTFESLTPGFRISFDFAMQCSLPEVSSRRINVEMCCSLSRHELLNILDHLSSHICGDESLCALLRIIPVSHPTHQSDEGWAPFSTNRQGFRRLSPPRLSIAVLLSLDAFSNFHPFLAEKQRCVYIQNVYVCTFKSLPCMPSKRLSLLIFIVLLIFIFLLTALCSELSLRFASPSLPLSRHVSLFFSLNDYVNVHSFGRLSLSLCSQSPDFPKTLVQSLFGGLLASRRRNLSGYSCASLTPLGMKWACTCTGDGDVLVFVLVLVPVVFCVVLCCVVLLVVSCRVVSCRVVSCRVVSCRVVSCRVVSCRVVSCRVVSCRVVSCRVVSLLVCRCVLDCHRCVAGCVPVVWCT